MMDAPPLIFQFDSIQVDPKTFKIVKDGNVLSLEPKAFEVLVFLLNNQGRLVEKDELLEAVWKEAFVTPNALTRVIAQLRKTLGDDPKESRYIETVPTRGYRFIAEVKTFEGLNALRQVESSNAVSDLEASMVPSLLASPGSAKHSGLTKILFVLAALIGGVAAGAAVWNRMSGDEKPAVARTLQVTSSPLMDLYPAFSPDGQSLAYCALRNGKFEIFVKPLTLGSREVQVTTDGTDNLQPTWSPDGNRIAFYSRERGGIWVIPALGGIATQLSSFGSDPAWSPDGQWVAFQSDAPADINQSAFVALPPSTLWIVPAQGGAAKQVTQKNNPPGGHGAPAWSPDSKYLVFVSHLPGRSELWTVTPDGANSQQLDGGTVIFYDPIFSPDGNFLFWSTGAGNFQLWRRRISPTTKKLLGQAEEVANTGAALARYMTIAPDGKRIAYSSLMMANNIGSVNVSPQTGEATSAPTLLTQDTNRRKTAPSFSSDGKSIVYSMWRMGVGGELWLMDADGQHPRQLTAGLAGLPNWMPNGQSVSVVSKDSSPLRMWEIDIKSGKQSILSEQVFPVALGKMSPDGVLFAYNSYAGGAYNISILPIAGGPTKQLTFDQEMMGFPCWSRDSQWLALEMKRGENTQVAVLPRDGGTPQQITNDVGQSWPGGWAADHDRIVFAGLRNNIWNLYWVSRRTKAQKQLTNFTKPNTYVRYPVWSPQSDQIVYEYGETTGNIWMLELK